MLLISRVVKRLLLPQRKSSLRIQALLTRGGDLGWATPDIFDPAFRDALTRLNKGQMSAPVHSSFGWHLIELLDTRNVDKTDAAQKDRAYRMLMNRKFSEEAASWMQEQRASAYVKILSN